MRSLFPPGGRAYELFDSSVLLVVLTFFGFLLQSSVSAQLALAAVLDVVPEWAVGGVVVGAAVAAIGLSYTRHIDLGYLLAILAAAFVVGIYTLSMVLDLFLDGDWNNPVFVALFVYGSIFRRLMREEDRLCG